jgi:hypothetical protein
MICSTCKDFIIRYVLEASNEENERLAVFIARMRAEKRALFQAEVSRREGQDGAVPEKDAGAAFQERP